MCNRAQSYTNKSHSNEYKSIIWCAYASSDISTDFLYQILLRNFFPYDMNITQPKNECAISIHHFFSQITLDSVL